MTTGASNDIKQATNLARNMVTKYGFSKNIGMIHYGDDEEEVFIGRDLAHAKNFSDSTAKLIDEEVKKIIDECYEKAVKILRDNEQILHKCANLLLEKEKIGRTEFEELFGVTTQSDGENEFDGVAVEGIDWGN